MTAPTLVPATREELDETLAAAAAARPPLSAAQCATLRKTAMT